MVRLCKVHVRAAPSNPNFLELRKAEVQLPIRPIGGSLAYENPPLPGILDTLPGLSRHPTMTRNPTCVATLPLEPLPVPYRGPGLKRGLGAIVARLRTGSCIGNGGQRDTPTIVAKPSLIPTSSRDHRRAGLGNVTLNCLYFVGYVTRYAHSCISIRHP
jgi:hypothetical protein